MTSAPTFPPELQKSTRATTRTRELQRSERTRGEDAVPAPGHSTANVPADIRRIPGWGADLDPANRPAVPRELPSTVMTARGDVKHWQEPRTKKLVTNEQPGITPVFGETCPLRGLSGMLREYAYQYGEGTNRRWMTLILADRVNIAESMIWDALRGKPDRYLHEKQWGTKLRHSPETRRNTLLFGGLLISAVAIGVVATRMREVD